jgi:hypothetical protein
MLDEKLALMPGRHRFGERPPEIVKHALPAR